LALSPRRTHRAGHGSAITSAPQFTIGGSDEPMAPLIITIGQAKNSVYMQLGSFSLDDNQHMMKP